MMAMIWLLRSILVAMSLLLASIYYYLKAKGASRIMRAISNAIMTLTITVAVFLFLPYGVFEPWYGKLILVGGLVYGTALSFYVTYFNKTSF